MVKEIKKKHVYISKSLYDCIKYAQDNLKNEQKNKPSGKKKDRITFLIASDKLGKYLNTQKKNK